MISLRCLLLFLLALAGAWFILRICSRLFGVNMAAVLSSLARNTSASRSRPGS